MVYKKNGTSLYFLNFEFFKKKSIVYEKLAHLKHYGLFKGKHSKCNLSIKDFYTDLGVAGKAVSDKAFKSLIESIAQFKKIQKNKHLISFATTTKTSGFGVSFY